MATKSAISRRRYRKIQQGFHNRIMKMVYQDPGLLGRHTPHPDTIIFKSKEPPIIHHRYNSRVDIIFVYLFESKVEISAIEIKTGSLPQVAKGLIQLRNTKKDFSDYWFDWFTAKNLFRRLTPFTDYEIYLSLLLLKEKFTQPVEEWIAYKRRFKIGELKRIDNFF